MEKDDGFSINVYSPGNLIAKEITINGGVHLGGSSEMGGFSDEQIAQAIRAINGKGKPLNSKRKWAGVHWSCRWVSWSMSATITAYATRLPCRSWTRMPVTWTR